MSGHQGGSAAIGPDSDDFTVAQDGEYDGDDEPVDGDDRPVDEDPGDVVPDDERPVVIDEVTDSPADAD